MSQIPAQQESGESPDLTIQHEERTYTSSTLVYLDSCLTTMARYTRAPTTDSCALCAPEALFAARLRAHKLNCSTRQFPIQTVSSNYQSRYKLSKRLYRSMIPFVISGRCGGGDGWCCCRDGAAARQKLIWKTLF